MIKSQMSLNQESMLRLECWKAIGDWGVKDEGGNHKKFSWERRMQEAEKLFKFCKTGGIRHD